jgi:hypothetical protein
MCVLRERLGQRRREIDDVIENLMGWASAGFVLFIGGSQLQHRSR